MALDSYALTRTYSFSDKIKEMRREKLEQINALYDLAVDREENTTMNWKQLVRSPRVFDTNYQDSTHTRITVETIEPKDYFVAGDYFQYNNADWLCLNSHIFHNMYCRGLFQKCNNVLIWQNPKTLEILSRPAIIENATKYGVGQDFGKQIEVPTSSRRVMVVKDDETILINSPMRLMIGYNGEEPAVYRVTQNDNTTNNYGGQGICSIVCMASEYDKNVDNAQLRVCDYKDPNQVYSDETLPTWGKIIGRDDLRIGERRPYSCIFYDSDSSPVEYSDYTWNIDCDFKDKIEADIADGKIYLKVSDRSCLSKKFTLQVLIGGEIASALKVSIVDSL